MNTINLSKTIESIVGYCHRNSFATMQYEPESINVVHYTKSIIPATVLVKYSSSEKLLYVAVKVGRSIPASRRSDALELLNVANEATLRGNYHICHCCTRLEYSFSSITSDKAYTDAEIEKLFDEGIQTCNVFGGIVDQVINQQITLLDAITVTKI